MHVGPQLRAFLLSRGYVSAIEARRQGLIEDLQNTRQQITALLESVAHRQDWQPDPDHWSFRYIAAHLAAVEKECMLPRARRIVTEEQPHFDYYWNTDRDFSRHDLQDSLQEWANARREFLQYVRALPPEKLQRTGTHGTFGEINVVDLLKITLDHDREHLQEVRQLIGS